MTRLHLHVLALIPALLGVACSSEDGSPSTGSGGGMPSLPSAGMTSMGGGGASSMPTGGAPSAGSPGAGGAQAGAGSATSGGQATGGGAASAGAANGGTASAGAANGGVANGGVANGGAGAPSAGAGGNTGGVAGAGLGGSGGGSGGASPANPSEGCGKSGRPAGGMVTVQNDHIYTFPEEYDGTKPLPLLIGFHACGNPIDQFLNLTKGSGFETKYVRAFPRSSDSGGCWNYNTDISRVTKVYDELMQSYCIDKNRVFATGHSSGAQMIVQILTHAADARHVAFRAVAPVAASDYGAIAAPVPVMYIQGKMDSVRGNDGGSTVARFRAANGCMMTSSPYSAVMGCQSSGKTINPGCIEYAGCSAPTIWCSHDDPNYSGTSHGVPCFGIRAMFDFFEGFR